MVEHPDKQIRVDEKKWETELESRKHDAAMVAHKANIDDLLAAFLKAKERTPVKYRLPYFGVDNVINELAEHYRSAGWKVVSGSSFKIDLSLFTTTKKEQPNESYSYLLFS